MFISLSTIVVSDSWTRNFWVDSQIDNDLTISTTSDLTVGGGYPTGVTLEADGDLWVSGDWYQQGDMFLIDNPRINGSQTPYVDNAFNSGNTSHRWKEVHAIDFYGDGSNLIGVAAANTVWNRSGTDVYLAYNGDNVGIGTTSPTTKVQIVSADSASDYIGLYVDQNDNQNWAIKADGYYGVQINDGGQTALQTTGSGNVLFAGNVGIGTTIPWGELDVRDIGTNSISNIISSTFNDQTAFGPEIWFVKSHNDDGSTLTTTLNTELLGRLSFYGVDSGNDQDVGAIIDVTQDGAAGTSVPTTMHLRTYSSTGENPNQLVLASNGNVGIGTTSPTDALLDVRGTVSTAGDARWLEILYDDTAQVAGVGGGITFGGKYTDAGAITNFASVWSEKEDGTTGNYGTELHFGTRTHGATIADRMIIDSSGNVGIGTTNPNGLLHLEGDGPEIKIEDDNGLVIQMYAGDDTAYTGTTSAHPYNLRSGGNVAVTITNDLYVGIGTDDPAQKLQVKGIVGFETTDTTNYWAVYAHTDDTLRFNYNGAGNDEVTILSNGNVGIGTSSLDHDFEIGTGVYSEINAGESTFTTSSSRTIKQNIKNVTLNQSILRQISKIPVTTYDFKPEICNGSYYNDSDYNVSYYEDKCTNKIGLIAEDFHQIFGRGDVESLSGDEVKMALWLAIQEIQAEYDQKNYEIQQLKQLICLDHPEEEICQ